MSTLEMVLCLPILLFMMALMINFGTVACWKVRALSIAREAAWATRRPRTGNTNPRPDYWPEAAGATAGGVGNVPALGDWRVDQPVARGPVLYGTPVNENLLDPTRGLRRGTAGITREFPLLAKLGEYRLGAKTRLLDDKWQYQRTGLWANRQRRIPVIYELLKAPESLADSYLQAALAVLEAPFREDLAPLDRDDEFIYYGQLFGWGAGAPDFHPKLHKFCSLDLDVALQRVEVLIDRIQGKIVEHVPSVAQRMAKALIGLYRRVIAALEAQTTPDPPPPDVQAEISRLQAKIDILNQFLQTLLENDDGE